MAGRRLVRLLERDGPVKAVLARLQSSHAYRSWQRYGTRRGNLLAGGVAYLGFFSLVPALVLGFTVFGFVLRGQPALFDQVVAYVSQTLPGIVRDAANPQGIIDASTPPTPNALTLAGAVSLVTLVLSGLGWVDALREGVRAVFDQPTLQANPVLGKARDLGLLCTLGLALLLTGVLSTVVSAAASWVLGQLGVANSSTAGRLLLRALALAVVLVADFALMVIVLRLMSGLELARHDVAQGAAVGAVGLGVLKLVSGLLLASATSKPLLASFAVVIGLLVLMNLISRVMLLAAAWAATTVDDRPGPGLAARQSAARPQGAPLGPREELLPTFGQRSTDRTAIAAGAVLGVTLAVAVRTVLRELRAIADAARGN